jgi:hypothetical protein
MTYTDMMSYPHTDKECYLIYINNHQDLKDAYCDVGEYCSTDDHADLGKAEWDATGSTNPARTNKPDACITELTRVRNKKSSYTIEPTLDSEKGIYKVQVNYNFKGTDYADLVHKWTIVVFP